MRVPKTLWTTAVMIALIVAVTAPPVLAKKLSAAAIYIEINDTDGDAGIHVFLDGEGWDVMQMTGPSGVQWMVAAEGGIGQQGITEFFFESAEPSFDEQSLEELLALFPEGVYRFEGQTTEGKRLKGKARLTHDLPEAPVQLAPTEDDEVDPDDAVFSWQAVPDPAGSEIVGYEVIVECEEAEFVKNTARVGPDVTSLTIPPQVLDQDDADECKWEVIAIEASGNQTLSESEFSIE